MKPKQDAYEAKLAEITAILKDRLKYPTMPVKTYVQEANGLYSWAIGYDTAFSPNAAGDVPNIGVRVQSAYYQHIKDTTDTDFGEGELTDTVILSL